MRSACQENGWRVVNHVWRRYSRDRTFHDMVDAAVHAFAHLTHPADHDQLLRAAAAVGVDLAQAIPSPTELELREVLRRVVMDHALGQDCHPDCACSGSTAARLLARLDGTRP